MAFIRTVPSEDATGTLKTLYDQDRGNQGYVTNHLQALSLRPDVVEAFRALTRAIKANMDPRRFELATLAAAKALHSSYCMLSHASALRRMGAYDDAQLTDIARDYHRADLSEADVALMVFAEKLTTGAHEMTRDDVDRLRDQGLDDGEILDVALTAALRNFYSKLLDAIGAEPDAAYARLEPSLREALAVGRPIQGTASVA